MTVVSIQVDTGLRVAALIVLDVHVGPFVQENALLFVVLFDESHPVNINRRQHVVLVLQEKLDISKVTVYDSSVQHLQHGIQNHRRGDDFPRVVLTCDHHSRLFVVVLLQLSSSFFAFVRGLELFRHQKVPSVNNCHLNWSFLKRLSYALYFDYFWKVMCYACQQLVCITKQQGCQFVLSSQKLVK